MSPLWWLVQKTPKRVTNCLRPSSPTVYKTPTISKSFCNGEKVRRNVMERESKTRKVSPWSSISKYMTLMCNFRFEMRYGSSPDNKQLPRFRNGAYFGQISFYLADRNTKTGCDHGFWFPVMKKKPWNPCFIYPHNVFGRNTRIFGPVNNPNERTLWRPDHVKLS